MTTYNSTDFCDRCGRGLNGKGFILNLGMKICGICDYEINGTKEAKTNY